LFKAFKIEVTTFVQLLKTRKHYKPFVNRH